MECMVRKEKPFNRKGALRAKVSSGQFTIRRVHALPQCGSNSCANRNDVYSCLPHCTAIFNKCNRLEKLSTTVLDCPVLSCVSQKLLISYFEKCRVGTAAHMSSDEVSPYHYATHPCSHPRKHFGQNRNNPIRLISSRERLGCIYMR